MDGTVQRTVFSARHAGLGSDGMGTVSDDIGRYESTEERDQDRASAVAGAGRCGGHGR